MFVSALALAACLVAGCGPGEITWTPLETPVAAPDFALASLDGDPVRLADLRGQVVLVEFWATWCGPCRYSTPSLEHIYRTQRDRGVTVLLVNQAEAPETIRVWAEGRFTAPILLDARQEVAQRYQIRGLPTLLVIDPAGRIRYREAGYGGGMERNLRLILDELLPA